MNRKPSLQTSATGAAVFATALIPLGFLFYKGRTGDAVVVFLLAIWVLSPFVALAGATAASKRWSSRMRGALSAVTLVVILGSLASYAADAVRPFKPQAAFMFVLVPAGSWLFMAIAVAIAVPMSRSR